MERSDGPRLAVLIDADNTAPKWAEAIFEEIATLGEASVRRIYGDFSGPHLRSWEKKLAGLALIPHQQFAYTKGKNSSDIALVIDAMDLMHTGRFDGFVLVSSDSDFTRLAGRLREQGLQVFGIGRTNTPEAFRKACKRFIFVENLLGDGEALRDAESSGLGEPVGDGPGARESTARSGTNKPAQQAPPAALDKAEAVEADAEAAPNEGSPTHQGGDAFARRRLGPPQCHRKPCPCGEPRVRPQDVRMREARGPARKNGAVPGQAERGAGPGADETAAIKQVPSEPRRPAIANNARPDSAPEEAQGFSRPQHRNAPPLPQDDSRHATASYPSGGYPTTTRKKVRGE